MRFLTFALSLLADILAWHRRTRCPHEQGPWTYPPMCKHCGHLMPTGRI